MTQLKIKPGISGQSRVWVLEEKKGLKWKTIFRHEKLQVVVGMKNHLLLPERKYEAGFNFTPDEDKAFFKDKFASLEDND